MMETKLTDFSKEELQTLLEAVIGRIVEFDIHKSEWMKVFAKGELDAEEIYNGACPEAIKRNKHLQLFKVQILTAIGKVAFRESANWN